MMNEQMEWTRRRFLRALGVGAGAAAAMANGLWQWGCKPTAALPPGHLLGPNHQAGHRLRQPLLVGGITAAPVAAQSDVLIVGGGIAGLCAAWQLNQLGITDIRILELEGSVGGNSVGGTSPGGTPTPRGAHYLPLPGPGAHQLLELLTQLGLVTGKDPESQLPVYAEWALSFEPHDRLLLNGVWQPGLVPQRGIANDDAAQFARFLAQMEALRTAKGADHRPAFAIPIANSSHDEAFRKLDELAMAQWLHLQGYTSEHLVWYVDYCCRDDFGLGVSEVSAWAGLHYFASRVGAAANAPAGTVLTWPQGNGWLVEGLAQLVNANIETNRLALRIEDQGNKGVWVWAQSANAPHDAPTLAYQARRCIVCLPQHLLPRVVAHWPASRAPNPRLQHTPWVVANLTLPHPPAGYGEPLAWDNVSRHSPALGYVNAAHQLLTAHPSEWVLTYYWPLNHLPVAEARSLALHNTRDDWARLILADFDRMHPGEAASVTHLDVWVWGHGMAGPLPGAIWNPYRELGRQPLGNLFFAHTDHSGISIFEEAFYQGVTAANELAATL